MEFIKKFFSTEKQRLSKENEFLKEALKECSRKLDEKQEHINQTNAFWKKKMRNLKQSFAKKKEL